MIAALFLEEVPLTRFLSLHGAMLGLRDVTLFIGLNVLAMGTFDRSLGPCA